MAKRYSEKEDKFIVAFFECAGAQNLSRDLGRSASSITARAKKLKVIGAWFHYAKADVHSEVAGIITGRVCADFPSDAAEAELAKGVQ